jgi:hypothetical protein
MGIFRSKDKDASPAEEPLYAGLAGMYTADPGELAVQVFLRLFAPDQKSHHRPEAALGVLQRLGGVDEIPAIIVRGTMATPRAKYSLDPLYVQCVLLWERGLVAGRLSRGSEAHHHLVLLPRGLQALGSSDPAAALRRAVQPPPV